MKNQFNMMLVTKPEADGRNLKEKEKVKEKAKAKARVRLKEETLSNPKGVARIRNTFCADTSRKERDVPKGLTVSTVTESQISTETSMSEDKKQRLSKVQADNRIKARTMDGALPPA